MTASKPKLVFITIIILVLLFIGAYAWQVLQEAPEDTPQLLQPELPQLEQEQETFSSKLEAINQLKEVKQTNAPSIYDEKLLDSLGFFDNELLDKNKDHIIDSIFRLGALDYDKQSYRTPEIATKIPTTDTLAVNPDAKAVVDFLLVAQQQGLEHQLFFASNPETLPVYKTKDSSIIVVVDGNQTLKANRRLRMRLAQPVHFNNQVFPKNTPVYGFVSFKPNRALLNIFNINHHPVRLKAFDLTDGNEGIYVEHSFRAEAQSEVLGDIVDDINIAGVPQVSGLKTVFQRTNRNLKIKIVNNYKLILKPN